MDGYVQAVQVDFHIGLCGVRRVDSVRNVKIREIGYYEKEWFIK